MSEFPGTERFEVLRRLGAGGMGVVYAVHDRHTDAHVALKTLKSHSAQALYRMKREFRALQDLEHPNLCRLGELIESGGQWFFTMELIDGVDFLSYVARWRGSDADRAEACAPTVDATVAGTDPGLAPPSARSRFEYDERKLRAGLTQLGRGLEALHSAGRVHRDVKPSNILVEATGRVVLLDFGLVADADTQLQSHDGDAVGTAAYMAPEQAAAQRVTAAADLYATGVLLYECLTGRLPYVGTTIEILMDKLRASPAPPRALAPDVAPDLDELCVDLLAREPAARPNARRLLKRLGVADAPVAVGTLSTGALTHTPELVGRDAELAELAAAFDDTRDGQCAAVLVRGGSGFGKSAVVREFARQLVAEHPSAMVLSGKCYERESVPFKALDGIVDQLSRELRQLPDTSVAALTPRYAGVLLRLFPVLGRVRGFARAAPDAVVPDPHELRRRGFVAFRELLARIAERRPLVLVIDDLQWADADSQPLLEDLLEQGEAPACLFILCARQSIAGSPLHAALVGDDVRLRVITVSALPHAPATELARKMLAKYAPHVQTRPERLADEARGHPLHIAEIARHVGRRDATGPTATVTLEAAIAGRTRELTPVARELVRIVAIAGEPLPVPTLTECMGTDRTTFDRHASLLRLACLVKAQGAGDATELEPYHDRVAAAVARDIPAEQLTELHSRLALSVETTLGSARPELLLRHLSAAGEDRKATQHAIRAAERATNAVAFEQAAQLYTLALELPTDDTSHRRDLKLRLADALACAGHSARAAAEFTAAADGAVPATRLACANRAAELWLKSGHLAEGMDSLERVLAEVGEQLPSSPKRALWMAARARLRLRLRGLKWQRVDETEVSQRDLTRLDVYRTLSQGLAVTDHICSVAFQSRLLMIALEAGEPKRLAFALGIEAAFMTTLGPQRLARARAVWQRANAIAMEEGDPVLRSWIVAIDACMCFLNGQFARSIERCDEALEQMVALPGTTWDQSSMKLFGYWSAWFCGHTTRPHARAAKWTRDARRRNDRYLETSLRLWRGLEWLGDDDLAGAKHNLSEAHWTPIEDGVHLQHCHAYPARAWVALYEGTSTRAIDDMERDFRRIDRSHMLRIAVLRALIHYARGMLHLAVARDATRASAALRTARRLARSLCAERLAASRVFGLLVRAGLAARRGEQARAIAALESAASLASENDMAIHAAVARYRLDRYRSTASDNRAEAELRRRGIVAPARFCGVLSAGFDHD